MCDAALSVRVCETCHGGGGNVEGCADFVAKQCGRGVAAGAVYEYSWTKKDLAVDKVIKGFGV